MGRELSDRDRKILMILVPQLDELLKKGIDLEYRNILPPVANHHSRDEQDFQERLQRLSAEDMRYISDLIIDGSEGLGCLYPSYAEAFFVVVGKKLSSEVADQLREIYESGDGSCG
jgi:hypothetical protein